jgi:hypothetical protein
MPVGRLSSAFAGVKSREATPLYWVDTIGPAWLTWSLAKSFVCNV